MQKSNWYIGGIVVLLALLAWALYQIDSVQYGKQVLAEDLERAEVEIEGLNEIVQKKEEEVEVIKELLRILRQQSTNAAYDFSAMRALVEQATQTVGDIKKLEEADQELLAKYSKVYFLNEHYEPDSLTYIEEKFVLSDRNLQIKTQVQPFLMNMLTDMDSEGLTPRVISAFRSFDYQEQLKERNTVTYGTDTSNKFVADQGYSEHQLGTTVDLVNAEIGTDMLKFENSKEYTWLLSNAYKYGFVLSYPESNSYYAFEPWHWRFVGKELALVLQSRGEHFYDLPQREINEYRVKMFDQ